MQVYGIYSLVGEAETEEQQTASSFQKLIVIHKAQILLEEAEANDPVTSKKEQAKKKTVTVYTTHLPI